MEHSRALVNKPAERPLADIDPWIACVRRGDYAAAWQISDAVLSERGNRPCFHLPRHQQWVWNGTALAGKRVLIRCYHGLGDTIQFARYIPMVCAAAQEVTVWVQPALVEILREAVGTARVLPLHDGDVNVEYDVDVEIMELPHVFRSTLDTMPVKVPYLGVAGWTENVRMPGPDACHVGVVWQAGDWDQARSVPAALLMSLASVPNVVLHALQRGPALAEWRLDAGPISGADDAMEVARIMRALDLIISVDSFPAHLAGALGQPIWTLLQTVADWRWMETREDSPWYPTMRLFRQEHPGEWEPVIARVAAELRRFANRARLGQNAATATLAGA